MTQLPNPWGVAVRSFFMYWIMLALWSANMLLALVYIAWDFVMLPFYTYQGIWDMEVAALKLKRSEVTDGNV